MVYKCENCGDVCKSIKETFFYPGSHSSYGKSGKHFTGNYISDCCHANVSISEEDFKNAYWQKPKPTNKE